MPPSDHSRVRVLSVQHYPTFGGPYNEILRLEPSLNASGVETVVAITDEPGTALPRLRGRVELRPIPLRRLRLSRDPRLQWWFVSALFGDVRRLRRLIRDEEVDLVKVHGPHNPHGAIAARLERVPVVWVISSTRVPPAFRRIGVRLVRSMADSVLMTGESILSAYPGGDALRPIAVPYYPPVDVDAFHPRTEVQRAAAKHEFGAPGAPVVGAVANFNPQKGIDTFVAAAARISTARPDARFVVAGRIDPNHAAYQDRVRAQARAAGLLPDKLFFVGEREDVPRVLSSFDVKLLTSPPASEGVPTTVLEAAACGVPVVATDVGAVREVVEDGATGFVVEPGDDAAIAARVLDLLGDPSLRVRMGGAAREKAVAAFSVAVCATSYVRAFDLALRRGGRHGLLRER